MGINELIKNVIGINLREAGKTISAANMAVLKQIVDLCKSLIGAKDELEDATAKESIIPSDIREALLQGSLEAIQCDVRFALNNKALQGFCDCSNSPDRADCGWSTLNLEGTFPNGNVVVSCDKCRNWWIADYSKDDQGKVVFTNIKPAAQVVVAMESQRNGEDIQIDESAVALRESVGMDDDGIIHDACIIQPGWGSSGYYDSTVLKREAASFAGLQMFIDHPTSIEESVLPERSVKNLAAVLTNTTYKENGWKGPGVYGDVKVFKDFQAPIKEKAPYIGLSLYGKGKAKVGQAEGKAGKIIESIPIKRSVDFVTIAGAGGALMPLLESARGGENQTHIVNLEALTVEQLKEGRPDLVESLTVEIKESGKKEMTNMPVTEQDFIQLKESVDVIVKENADLKKRNAKLEEKDMLREAAGVVRGLVSATKLPNIMKERLIRDCVETPVTESGELDSVKLTDSVKAAIAEAEKEYAEIVGSGRVSGMGGGSGEPTTVKESVVTDMSKMFGTYEEPEKK